MEGRKQKKQRLLAFANCKRGSVDHSSLAEISNFLRVQRGPDTPCNRWMIGRAVLSQYSEVQLVLRLPLKNGEEFAWYLCSPGQQLRCLVNESSAFRSLVGEATALHTSLHMLFYADEATPGNVIRPDTKRKIWNIYWSFEEFGQHRLFCEEVWMPMGCLRVAIVKQVQGGFSNCMRILLRHCFVAGVGEELSTRGLSLRLDRGNVIIQIMWGKLISDWSARSAFWSTKGAGGRVLCLGCKNVTAIAQNLQDDYIVDCSCSDTERFDERSDEDCYEAWDLLAASKTLVSAGQFEELEKNCGLSYDEDAILGDIDLRAHIQPSKTCYDWFHNALQGGIINIEAHLFLKRCKEVHGLQFVDVGMLADANWVWPSASSGFSRGKVKAVFTDSREKASSSIFKASGSEMLTIYPHLRYFAEQVVIPLGRLDQECASLFAALDVLDELLKAKRQRGNADRLAMAVKSHLEKHVACYGKDRIIPKHHAICHAADQIRNDDIFLDTFVQERYPQVVFKIANPIKLTKMYEKSVVARVHSAKVAALQAFKLQDGLAGHQVAAPPALCLAVVAVRGMVASSLRLLGHTYSVGDIVFVHDAWCMIECCCMMDDIGDVLVFKCLQLVGDLSATSSKLRRSTRMFQARAAAVSLVAFCWSEDADGDFVVLHCRVGGNPNVQR